MMEVQISIIFFALGAFLMYLIIEGIIWIIKRVFKRRKIHTTLATPRVMFLGVNDGEHQKNINT